jgi:DNA-directed RNA polymerase beta subunit
MMVNNMGLRLVKIRVVQDRMPELGDKFSNRHGQKGTIGALLRGHDMPRTKDGIVPDMIMNPHAIPSRMTIAQNLEQLLGKTAALSGGIGLLVAAHGFKSLRMYGRAPAVLANLIAIGVAKYMFEAGLWWAAVPLTLYAVITIFCAVSIIPHKVK